MNQARSIVLRAALVALIALGIGQTAQAQCASSFSIVAPTTITVPGCYTLDATITIPPGPGPGGVTPITIASSNVHLDLSGNTLNVPPTGVLSGIQVNPGLWNITIRNGIINGGTFGITVQTVVDNFVVEDMQFFGAANAAVDVRDGTNVAIRRNEVRSCGRGFSLTVATIPSTTGTIEHNLLFDTDLFPVVVVNGSNVAVLNNRIDGTMLGVAGITLIDTTAFEVSHNTVSNSTANGIDLNNSANGRVTGNTVSGSAGHGIELLTSRNTLLLDNVVGGSTLTGMRINGSWNHLERNTLNGNGQSNLWFDAGGGATIGNTYGRNSITSGGTQPSACGVPTSCNPASVCNDGIGSISFGDNIGGTGPC